jgi:hypothetical protein
LLVIVHFSSCVGERLTIRLAVLISSRLPTCAFSSMFLCPR